MQSHGLHGSDFESRRCAAEEAALQLGWLRECPYHGEPFKAPGARAAVTDITTRAASKAHMALVRLATELPDAYAEQCPLCARESAFPE